MPWCELCAKFWTPSSMSAGGECPSCGRVLARAGESAAPSAQAKLTGADLREMAGESGKAPWHFKLMVAALAVYLGWRVVQLVLLLFR